MPIIRNEMGRPTMMLAAASPQQNGIATTSSQKMIRVDYQKKLNSTDASPTGVVSPAPPPSHLSLIEGDRGSTSPVSSIQEEFYSYLGISSKASGGDSSDAEPTTTTPSKCSLDDFDLSKRRSLRVRVVNKLKAHQEKLLKMAESAAVTDSPDETPEIKDSVVILHPVKMEIIEDMENKQQQMARSQRLASQSNSSDSASSNTILARRCYAKPSKSPSPTVRIAVASPLFLTPPPSNNNALRSPLSQGVDDLGRYASNGEVFSDFEDEIKKHVQLTSRPSATPPLPTASVEPPQSSTTPVSVAADSVTSSPSSLRKQSKAAAKQKRIKKKIITKRIIIHRTRKDFTPHRKRYNSTSSSCSKWPTSKRRKNQNNNNNNEEETDLRPCSVILPKCPEFSVVLKSEDAKPYTVLDVDVPKEAPHGPILGTFYYDQERVLLVVTEKEIVFFQRHTNVVMFQKLLALSSNRIGQKPRNSWSKIDSVPRLRHDELVGKLLFEQQIMRLAGDDEQQQGDRSSLVYLEVRAQPLQKDLDYRTGEMSAVYLNLYYLSRGGDPTADRTCEVKSICLDTIVATSKDISYVILPHELSVVVCWNERQSLKSRLGICKYKLAPDFESLLSVEEFQGIDGELSGLRWNGPNYVIGTGNQQISIWDQRSGALLSNIHLKDFELGDTIYAQVMNVDKNERHLLLVQFWQNYLNVLHVNLLDFQYRVLRSRELSCTKSTVQSVVKVEAGDDGANIILGLVAAEGDGAKGDAHEMLQIFDALSNRLVAMKRHEAGTRLFLNENYLIKLGDRLEPESISIQAVNEFLFNLL